MALASSEVEMSSPQRKLLVLDLTEDWLCSYIPIVSRMFLLKSPGESRNVSLTAFAGCIKILTSIAWRPHLPKGVEHTRYIRTPANIWAKGISLSSMQALHSTFTNKQDALKGYDMVVASHHENNWLEVVPGPWTCLLPQAEGKSCAGDVTWSSGALQEFTPTQEGLTVELTVWGHTLRPAPGRKRRAVAAVAPFSYGCLCSKQRALLGSVPALGAPCFGVIPQARRGAPQWWPEPKKTPLSIVACTVFVSNQTIIWGLLLTICPSKG